MMNYTFTKEDVELVEKFIDIKNKGFYVDSTQLTEAYNRILHKNVNNTSCGSCLRQRTNELEEALNHFKKSLEIEKKEDPVTIPQEENKAVRTKKNKK